MEFSAHRRNVLEKRANTLKALAHPVRLCIVQGLAEQGSRTVSAIQHCVEVPQSTVSQHLSTLRHAGILKAHREGTNVRYEVVDEFARAIVALIDAGGSG